MSELRQCCRPGCAKPARATLTFDYPSSTAVVGPLSHSAEPHSWDFCETHADRITVPRGWDLVRGLGGYREHRDDDLTALADSVRETAFSGSAAYAARPRPDVEVDADTSIPEPVGVGRHRPRPGRRGHLRVLPDPE